MIEKKRGVIVAIIVLFLGTEMIGCALSPKRTSQQVIDDSNVTSRVRNKLANDAALNLFKIDVETHQGIVTLAGHVPTEERKGRAGDLASSVEGVKMVENLLNVGQKRREERFEDAVITSKVTSGLVRNPATHSLTIDVETNKGQVFLTGRVRSEEEKREAERIARNINGVVAVENQLKVAVD